MIDASRQPIQGRTIAVQVLSRSQAKHIRPEVPYIVISIANSNVPPTTLSESPLRLGVLRLAFDDIEANRADYRGNRQAMTAGHAREIRTFIEEHLVEAERIVVHCEAGISRSPAVAAALWRWLEGQRGPFFETFRPNAHVYRTLLDELA